MKKPGYIIVAGTSAGGLKALTELVSTFKEMDAAVCILMHLSRAAISDFLLLRLQPLTSFKCFVATDEMPIEAGCIYIAPPNAHLLVEEDALKLGYGPEENRWKPSVDVLFRSAAASWSNKTIGIVLTGLLDDGTTGMLAIKKSGGITMVQDPNEAEFPSMPLSVLNAIEVDHCLPLSSMGEVLQKLTQEKREKLPPPKEVMLEAQIASRVVITSDILEQLGSKSQFACPDCGGGLYTIKEINNTDRYRCHLGHAYTEPELALKQNEALEATLWVALRLMEERRSLLVKMEKSDAERGYRSAAATYQHRIHLLNHHIEKLKELLFSLTPEKMPA